MPAPRSNQNQNPNQDSYYAQMGQTPSTGYGQQRHGTINAASGKDSFGNYINPVQRAAAAGPQSTASLAPVSPFGDMPKYDVFDATGRLKSIYKQGNNYNTGDKALNALEARGMSKGPSPWLNMQNQKIGMEANNQRDQAGRDAAYGLGAGMSNLASSGGLDSGARERMASGNALGRMSSMQSISNQTNMNRIGMGVEDERQKLAILQGLPGARLAQSQFKAGIDQNNINREFGAFTNDYNEKMKGWAANKTGNAIGSGGNNNGGILGWLGF